MFLFRVFAFLSLFFIASFASANVTCVQTKLNLFGYEAGVADGLMGNKTREASNAYLETTGEDLPELTNATAAAWCDALSDTSIPVSGLEGVGINTAFMWSGASEQDPRFENRVIDHIVPIQEHGFNSLFIVACIDWVINQRCKKPFQTRENLIKSVRIALENTELHISLSFKGYETKKVQGKNISTLQEKLESNKETQAAFIEEWKLFAKEFKDVPRERLSFVLLNEPEFQLPDPTRAKRQAWEAIASSTIEAIREINPDRVIILEGIAKSKFNERWKKVGSTSTPLMTCFNHFPIRTSFTPFTHIHLRNLPINQRIERA